MFIKLTNAADGRQDDPIHINSEHITAVYEDHTDGGSLITKVYGQTGIVWTVQESLSEVVKMLPKLRTSFSKE
jgi:hypothetical protein